ncbi:MAG TPA: citrate synthase [Gammaproteobacteria bacterium]|nr:citrate synthase [Gammaproteobacteria bacterium]
MSNKAILTLGKEVFELPVLEDTYGNKFIQTTSLNQKTGYYTIDPAYKNTASCESDICYIGGKESLLIYRGYEINYLAENHQFTEVCYLLYFGHLPSQEEHHQFIHNIKTHQHVSDNTVSLLKSLPKNAHPMSMLLTIVSSLSTLLSWDLDMKSTQSREHALFNILGQLPVIVAMIYNYKQGKPVVLPNPNLDYTENYLYMLFSNNDSEYKPSEKAVEALNKIFILHADHEQNASTSAVRSVGSTGVNSYACITAGIAALWGHLHGGANEECLNMLKEIGSLDNIPKYIDKAINSNDPFRLYGFGHRVYKSYDPRAQCLRSLTHSLIKESSGNNVLLNVAMELEQQAMDNPYFQTRNLYPNVDFYSGLIQSALGLNEDMFTTTFALGRAIGWLSHLEELISRYPHAITRPRQRYLGSKQKPTDT